jgi:hypothetical protein
VKRVIATTFAVGLLGTVGSAWAQPTKGSGTFTIAGVINTQLPQNGQKASANGMFTLGLGTFVASRTQLFVGPVVNISAGGGFSDPSVPFAQDESSVQASLGATVAVKQLFGGGGSKTFPYVGLHAQVLDFSGGTSFAFDENGLPVEGNSSFLDTMLIGTTVGFKSYLKENVALDLGAQMGAPIRNLSSGLRNISVVAAIEYLF